MFKYNNISEFYPTPASLVENMVYCVDFKKINSVLEPSAGNGMLADGAKARMKYTRSFQDKDLPMDIDTIEIDNELRYILKGKGYRVVHDDFLSFHTKKQYDLILMNPPFSDGDKHLLKAIEMQENGGIILCLLNADTIRNPYTNSRKLLCQKLKDYTAEIKYFENAFIEAERSTGVDIAFIKIEIPAKDNSSFIVEQLRQEQKYSEPDSNDYYGTLIENDLVKAFVLQYDLEVEAGIRLITEYRAMMKNGGISCLRLDFNDNHGYYDTLSINEFVRRVRKKYWLALFDNPMFTGLLTRNLKDDYDKRVDSLIEYDFSLYNIYTLKCEMSQNLIKGVEDTIIKLFDELSITYHWHEETGRNIHYYNGWKTNKAYYINQKVIIPHAGYITNTSEYIDLKGKGYKEQVFFKMFAGEGIKRLEDMEKVMNYLDGGLTDEVDIIAALRKAAGEGQTRNIPLKFFTVTFYKKGTCHITFNNPDLLKKFNIYGSQRKGWLPPAYGKTKYSDMTQEEKAVIDEFEGEESYNKTMQNKGYFIFDSSTTLMIEGRKSA